MTTTPPRERIRRQINLSTKPIPVDEFVKKFYTDSKQLEDPFNGAYAAGQGQGFQNVWQPPYNLGALIRMPRENNILGQCIKAMVTNTVGHGFYLEYVGPDGKKNSGTAQAEKKRLMGLLDMPNEDMTLRQLLERFQNDRHTVGYGILEIGRDTNGLVVMVAHIPAHTIRITHKDDKPTTVTYEMMRDGKLEKVTLQKYFRRYVQRVGGTDRYFKELGDPRKIDPATGMENKALKIEDTATEILYDGIYAPGEVYGVPHWVNQIPSITGSRESELVNLSFFKENAIPAMALLVSGGYLTQDALEQLEAHFTGSRGRDSMNRVLVLEVEADTRTASTDGALTVPKVEMKTLQGERQQDALFLDYDNNAQGKIRSSFRLPPVFVGGSQDYTYASAKTSFEVAESQVFSPERRLIEDFFNRKILADYQPKYWAFKLDTAKISDPAEVISAVTAFDNAGAMTMNSVITLANEYFGSDMPTIEDAWGDWPFQIVKQLAINGTLDGIKDIADTTQNIPSNAGGAVPGKPPANGGTPKKPKQPAPTGAGDKTKAE